MTLSFIRCLFLLMCSALGYYLGLLYDEALFGIELGCLIGLVVIFLESQMRRVSVRGLSSMVFGLLLGFFMAKMISDILALIPLGTFVQSVSRVVLTLFFSYFGAVMALRGKDEFSIIIPYVRFKRQDERDKVVLLDTSVIIDGRLSQIYKLNFIPGRLVVSRSVLLELQTLADSSDDIKRQRGRRGLDMLKMMQNDPKVDLSIHEDEVNTNQKVDERLIELAKIMEAGICTNDFNLAEVATLQGIETLNIQDLVKVLKSVVFAGDELNVKLVKEGKEQNQAVGYLDDGTMIVVSNARNFIGQDKHIRVTSILQTQAGKMIFAEVI